MENQQVTNKQTIVMVPPSKSVGLAILLSLFFGPLGMFYSTIAGAIVMLIMNLIAVFFTLGFGLFLTWPIGIIWAAVAAGNKSKKVVIA